MSAVLSLVGVEKGFSRGGEWTPVLSGIDLELHPGEITAINAGRLQGKTTLLKIAAGIQRPDKGTIHLQDQNLTNTSDRHRSKLLGRQITWIDRDGPGLPIQTAKYVGWPLTLHGHKRRQAEAAAAQALTRVGAPQCANRHWHELSNQQRVLVGLARAFIANPTLIIIDDLLDAHSPQTTEQTSDLLRNLIDQNNPHPAVLISTTDIESAIYADHIHTINSKHTLHRIGRERAGEVIPLRWIADNP
jgi:putative ABC transport system ATP-binding protein